MGLGPPRPVANKPEQALRTGVEKLCLNVFKASPTVFNFSIPQKQSNFSFQPLRPHMIRKLLSKILLLFFCSVTFIPLVAQHKAEILWDNYGVPHIFSNTTE